MQQHRPGALISQGTMVGEFSLQLLDSAGISPLNRPSSGNCRQQKNATSRLKCRTPTGEEYSLTTAMETRHAWLWVLVVITNGTTTLAAIQSVPSVNSI